MLIVTGLFSLHRLGFGFVPPKEAILNEDVFIPATKTMNALDGDLVEVEVSPIRKKNKGPEGKIVKVISRKKQSYMAVCVFVDNPGELMCFLPSLGRKKTVYLEKTKEVEALRPGDRLEIKIEKWGEPADPIHAELIQAIGNIDVALDDNLFAALELQIPTDFPPEVLEEVKQFSTDVLKEECVGRTDFTQDLVVTIDPDTAQDYDDALSLDVDKEGNFHLNVHIADVSHYVKPGSNLDTEAKKRGNSTYLIGSVLPMLPKALSNELCSLKEGVERLTVSVMMSFDPTGKRTKHKITRGVIRSKKRLTYKNALSIINGETESDLSPLLGQFVALAKLLKKRKQERGCLEIELDDLVFHVDEKGEPTGYEVVHYDITHQLVEEFMLQANEVIAETVDKKYGQGIFRSHEHPDPENLKEFFRFAQSLGVKVPLNPNEHDLEKVFAMSKNTPFEQMVTTAYIRCLKLAKYTAKNLGHFSLFLDHYCHFTSPIRRYSDLVIHRQLFEKVDYYSTEALDTIAAHLSKTERNSFKAEQLTLMWKKLRLLEKWSLEGKKRYAATITKIKSKGMLANISPLNFDYFIEVRDLKDHYRFNPEKNLLIGSRTKQTFQVGMQGSLTMIKIDLKTLSTKWQLSPPKRKN